MAEQTCGGAGEDEVELTRENSPAPIAENRQYNANWRRFLKFGCGGAFPPIIFNAEERTERFQVRAMAADSFHPILVLGIYSCATYFIVQSCYCLACCWY